jgi:hypothetical protein
MRKMVLAALLALFPSIAYSQNVYVEGSVGFLATGSLETDSFSLSTPNGLFDGTLNIEDHPEWAAGLEGGYMFGQWRFGAAWDFMASSVTSAQAVGTLDGTDRHLCDDRRSG